MGTDVHYMLTEVLPMIIITMIAIKLKLQACFWTKTLGKARIAFIAAISQMSNSYTNIY